MMPRRYLLTIALLFIATALIIGSFAVVKKYFPQHRLFQQHRLDSEMEELRTCLKQCTAQMDVRRSDLVVLGVGSQQSDKKQLDLIADKLSLDELVERDA